MVEEGYSVKLYDTLGAVVSKKAVNLSKFGRRPPANPNLDKQLIFKSSISLSPHPPLLAKVPKYGLLTFLQPLNESVVSVNVKNRNLLS
jgi:hypothetical protein